jgi:microcystin-dependent protein
LDVLRRAATYGGDGQETFCLPDMRGRVPIHIGNGFTLAETGGVETVTLAVPQIASHTHPFVASVLPSTDSNPRGRVLAQTRAINLYTADNPTSPLSASALAAAGGNQPHSNFQPYLCVNFIISLFGVFPSQT